jgi:uncharacterized protein with ParB-like and HNH nuclease domain
MTNRVINELSLMDFLLENKFVVPDFQREYSWSIEKAQEFKEFILEQNKIVFFGNIVLLNDGEKGKFNIIDGQQRVTTSLILLLAIYKRIPAKIEKGSILSKMSNNIFAIIEKLNNSDDKWSSNDNKSIDKIISFVTNCDSKIKSPHYRKIEKTFNYFYNDFLNSENIVDVYTRISELVFNKIVTSDEEEALNIFINLNSKGTPLSRSDIIKSKFFNKAIDDSEKEKIKNFWEKIIEELGSDKLDKFFLFYLNSINSDYYSQSTILKQFDSLISSKDLMALLEELEKFFDIYCHILLPDFDYWNVLYPTVYFIKMFNFKQIFPIISIIKTKIIINHRKYAVKLLNNLLTYMVRTSTINNVYGTTPKTFIAKVKRDLFLLKRENYKDDFLIEEVGSDAVISKLNTLLIDSNNTKLSKFLLIKFYEKELQFLSYDYEVMNYDELSLEHMVDKKNDNLFKYFYKLNDSKVGSKEEFEALNENERARKYYINMVEFWVNNENEKYKFKLGNFTLMNSKKNSELGHSGKKYWRNKVIAFNDDQSFYKIANEEYDLENFTENQINNRTKYIIEKIVKYKILEYDDWA